MGAYELFLVALHAECLILLLDTPLVVAVEPVAKTAAPFVSASLGISMCKVNLKALDSAYSIAFPKATPIIVNKKLKIEN